MSSTSKASHLDTNSYPSRQRVPSPAPMKYCWYLVCLLHVWVSSAILLAAGPSEGSDAPRPNMPKYRPISQELARTLKYAHLASNSYFDAQIGLLLKTQDDLDLRENTIIVFWGDHVWHLGDIGLWGKATKYVTSTRVPLTVYVPQMKVKGATTNGIVELVDIFQSLCFVCAVSQHLLDHSFAPLLNKSERSWKHAAFSQNQNWALRAWGVNPLFKGTPETCLGPSIKDVEQRIMDQQGESWNRELFEKHVIGYTVRTDRFLL